MKIATWNVNGIRARREQFLDWVDAEAPDVICLQEIKVSLDKLPADLSLLPGFAARWHGTGGYSGVALLVRDGLGDPEFGHPELDFEERLVTARWDDLTVASVYVPNGGKDYAAKLGFLDAFAAWAEAELLAGRELVLAGDFNVAREERDVHPKERKPEAIGQRAEERQRLERFLGAGLVDLGRHHAPDDEALFTWWAPWRNLRQRNIGWRIDYLLASPDLARRSLSCLSQREVGSSDHAPVVAEIGD